MWRRQYEGKLWDRLLRECIAKCRYDNETIMIPKQSPIKLSDILPLNDTARLIVMDEAVDDIAVANNHKNH
jgi:hypothetical protein